MSLELFQEVPAGAIDTLFDDQNQPLFKRSELGKQLGIEDFSSHCIHPRSDLKERVSPHPLGREKNLDNIFINLDGAIEMAVPSKKLKAVALVKRLTKKSVEKIQEEHLQAIEKKDATIALLNHDLKNCEHDNVTL